MGETNAQEYTGKEGSECGVCFVLMARAAQGSTRVRVRCDVEQAGNQERGKSSVAARDVEGGGRVLAKAGVSGSLPVLEMAIH